MKIFESRQDLGAPSAPGLKGNLSAVLLGLFNFPQELLETARAHILRDQNNPRLNVLFALVLRFP